MADAKRVRVKIADFIRAWEGSTSVKEVAEKTGIKLNSVMARASKYRTELAIPLKNMPRGGGVKVDVEAARNLVAELQGVAKESAEKATS